MVKTEDREVVTETTVEDEVDHAHSIQNLAQTIYMIDFMKIASFLWVPFLLLFICMVAVVGHFEELRLRSEFNSVYSTCDGSRGSGGGDDVITRSHFMGDKITSKELYNLRTKFECEYISTVLNGRDPDILPISEVSEIRIRSKEHAEKELFAISALHIEMDGLIQNATLYYGYSRSELANENLPGLAYIQFGNVLSILKKDGWARDNLLEAFMAMYPVAISQNIQQMKESLISMTEINDISSKYETVRHDVVQIQKQIEELLESLNET